MPERSENVTALKVDPPEAKRGEAGRAATSPASPATSAGPAGKARRRIRQPGWGLLVSLLVVVAAGYLGVREFQARTTHVFEQDARIAADLVTVSSRVSGWITAVSMREAERVEAGAVLVTIDDRETRLRLTKLQAQLAGLEAEGFRLHAARELADAQIDSRIRTRMSEVVAAQSAIDSLRPQLNLADSELKRAESLYANKVIAKRQLDQARAEMQRLEGDLQTATAELAASEAKLKEARAELARLKVYDGEIQVLEHRRAEVEADLEQQRLDLRDRVIRAPVAGVIDRSFVELGEYVTPGQRLALMHDPARIVVEANIKETEIRRVRVGQPVAVHVDAYPDAEFTGKVISVGNAATSEFALLPSPNPSGNFTKTTQRLRTLIAVEQREGLLRPGMMVEVSIDVRPPPG